MDSTVYGCFGSAVSGGSGFHPVPAPSGASSQLSDGTACTWGTLDGSYLYSPFGGVDTSQAHDFFFWGFGIVLSAFVVAFFCGVIVSPFRRM